MYKNILFLYLIVISCICSSQETATKIPLIYEISPVFNFKRNIVSVTFDDGVPNNFTKAIPLLNERDVPATFYLNTMKFDSYYCKLITENNINLHEFGSHTVNHKHLSTLTAIEMECEMVYPIKSIDSLLMKRSCLTIAYPFGDYNFLSKNIAKKYFIGARTFGFGFNDLSLLDRYALLCIPFGPVSIEKMNNYVRNLNRWENKWMIEVFHGLDDIGWEPISESNLKKHLDLIDSCKNDFWITTVTNGLKYFDESQAATVYCVDCNTQQFLIRIEDYLEDSLYNLPVSIRLKVPFNWSDSVSIENGAFLKTIERGYEKFVLFNSLPNNQNILIKPLSINNQSEGLSVIISPNPFQNYISIENYNEKSLIKNIKLFNIEGKLIKEIVNDFCYLQSFFSIDTLFLMPNIYILRIETNNGISVRKLIKN